MKTKLTQSELESFLPNIRFVLERGEGWSDEKLHHPAGAIIDAVLTIKGMAKNITGEGRKGFDTNGWQWDWWQQFTYEGKDYTLSGSGYYGGHSFHLSD
jgi:hypothetical protein